MTRIAILDPETLVGQEVKTLLGGRSDLWSDLRLLSTGDHTGSSVTEIGGAAAVIQPFHNAQLDHVDVLFVCSEGASDALSSTDVPASLTTILVSPGHSSADALPIVAGVNSDQARRGGTLISPHAGAIALSHLLAPLCPLGLSAATAVVLQPASARSQAGIEELLEQARAILNFSTDWPHQVFGSQLAFNLLPVAETGAAIGIATRAAVGGNIAVAVQTLQSAVFHSIATSVKVQLDPTSTLETVQEHLAESTYLEIADQPDLLGPIDGAGQERVLLGSIEAAGENPGAFWLWAVMDNLTLGGAGNAIAIAEALLVRPN